MSAAPCFVRGIDDRRVDREIGCLQIRRLVDGVRHLARERAGGDLAGQRRDGALAAHVEKGPPIARQDHLAKQAKARASTSFV
jgi:hypothetical protein